MEPVRRTSEPLPDQAFAAFFARVLPLLPRGWGASLQIEDPLTRSLEEVARGGHAVIEKPHRLWALAGERGSQPEQWALQQAGIREHRLLPLPGERPLGRLALLA